VVISAFPTTNQKVGTKALQVSHLRAAPSSKILPSVGIKVGTHTFIFMKASVVFVERTRRSGV